jgi:integral membrane protein
MKKFFATPRLSLINTGHAEGVSFLVLLFIAMPLKYMCDMPMAVRIAGSIHGILFIAFITVLWDAKNKMPLNYATVAKAFVLSIVPFGTFFIKKIL